MCFAVFKKKIAESVYKLGVDIKNPKSAVPNGKALLFARTQLGHHVSLLIGLANEDSQLNSSKCLEVIRSEKTIKKQANIRGFGGGGFRGVGFYFLSTMQSRSS